MRCALDLGAVSLVVFAEKISYRRTDGKSERFRPVRAGREKPTDGPVV